MYMPRGQVEPRYALDGAEAEAVSRDAPLKWTARRTLMFVTSASCLLWALIISAANQIM